MKIRLIMVCVSCAIYAMMLATLGLRSKKVLSAAGERRMFITAQSSHTGVFVIVLCLALILLILLRDLGVFMNAIVCIVGLLGTEIGCRSLIYNKNCGIYERGILADGKFFLFADIKAIPSFLWEDRTETDTMELVSEKHGTVYIRFASSEECTKAETLITQLEPRFKKQ